MILGALIDLSADNAHQATLTFLASWEREPDILSKAQLRFLRAFSRRVSLAPHDAERVLDLLKQKCSGLDELRTLIPIMFRLALLARDMQTAVAIVDRALVVDEQSYLAAQPDAAEQVSAGLYKSVLDHFIHSVEVKGDEDFLLLHELKSALKTLMGVDIPIVSLRPYVISLAQGHVATPTKTKEPLLPPASNTQSKGNGMQISTHPVSRPTAAIRM